MPHSISQRESGLKIVPHFVVGKFVIIRPEAASQTAALICLVTVGSQQPEAIQRSSGLNDGSLNPACPSKLTTTFPVVVSNTTPRLLPPTYAATRRRFRLGVGLAIVNPFSN